MKRNVLMRFIILFVSIIVTTASCQDAKVDTKYVETLIQDYLNDELEGGEADVVVRSVKLNEMKDAPEGYLAWTGEVNFESGDMKFSQDIRTAYASDIGAVQWWYADAEPEAEVFTIYVDSEEEISSQPKAQKKKTIPNTKAVEKKIAEEINQILREEGADMGLVGVKLKNAPKNSGYTWAGTATFESGSGRWSEEIAAFYDDVLEGINWWYANDTPPSDIVNTSTSGTGLGAWMKAVNEGDDENIVALFDSLTPADIEELTTKYAHERENFNYDLNDTGDGVVITKFNASYDIYPFVIIPKTIEEYPVVEIKGFGQSRPSIMVVVLPNTIKKLSDNVSFSKYIHKINFPEGLEYIGEWIFVGSSLTGEIVIPSTVKEIGECAFRECKNLTSVKFENGIKKIGEESFNRTAISEIVLPNSVETIGSSAFAGCSYLTSVKFGTGIKDTGSGSFQYTAISEIVLPDSVETIGGGAFADCNSLKKITFSKNIKAIKEFAFLNCTTLSDIIIPEEVTAISFPMAYDHWDPNQFNGCGVIKLASRKRLQDLGYKGSF